MWYPWGPTEEHMCSIKPWGNKYQPPKHFLDAAVDEIPRILPLPLPSSNNSRHQELPKYWLKFSACGNEQWAQKVETPLEKQAHVTREWHPPTGGKVEVYHWVENVNGQHVHTLFTKRENEDTFELYKYQIFYDSRYNKWDCSTNFGDFNDDDDDSDPDPRTLTPEL